MAPRQHRSAQTRGVGTQQCCTPAGSTYLQGQDLQILGGKAAVTAALGAGVSHGWVCPVSDKVCVGRFYGQQLLHCIYNTEIISVASFATNKCFVSVHRATSVFMWWCCKKALLVSGSSQGASAVCMLYCAAFSPANGLEIHVALCL